MQYDEITTEIEANTKLNEIVIRVKSEKGLVLEPQVILDAIVDVLLINYGPFLDDKLPKRSKENCQ